MRYFLRFTNTASEDLERGTSLLDLPSLDTPEVLDGLCGFSFCDIEEIDFNILSEDDIESKVKVYQNNVHYSGTPTIFKGKYISQNPNGEGVVFEAIEIYKSF